MLRETNYLLPFAGQQPKLEQPTVKEEDTEPLLIAVGASADVSAFQSLVAALQNAPTANSNNENNNNSTDSGNNDKDNSGNNNAQKHLAVAASNHDASEADEKNDQRKSSQPSTLIALAVAAAALVATFAYRYLRR